ncbi:MULTISPECIES: glutamate racemase [unclassified Roseitalea]|uniref:glutamate racemase n=1 Tax=unclassified Roseitalea TaxID=2639107 RepID=UPI00273F3C37|nr:MULTISPECIES: glutamate racemase [unclassified Roseitalea]
MGELRQPSVLFFDSGIGGLSVVKEARIILPDLRIVYVADDAAFPYGAWQEGALLERLRNLMGELVARYRPGLIVIACNTASTLAIDTLRADFPDQIFVGTVPAIKPAAERTRSGLVSVLATPGTVRRQYTRELIRQYAARCHVRLVASETLAALAETYMRTGFVDETAVAREIAPCFVQEGGRRTDIVVLACTHYPFLVNRMRKTAPWPVDWIDTSEAIARRAQALAEDIAFGPRDPGMSDVAGFTSGNPGEEVLRLARGFGLLPALA